MAIVAVVVVYLHENNQFSKRYENNGKIYNIIYDIMYNSKLTPCKQGPHRSSKTSSLRILITITHYQEWISQDEVLLTGMPRHHVGKVKVNVDLYSASS